MIDYSQKTTEWLQYKVEMTNKYPQFNSPSDRAEGRAAAAELKLRSESVPNPTPSSGTDFAYRLQRYGY